ncbi:GNAT family N-acetyltransferase [Flexibacterium corallicola]|uniref:GNAT family N-acetyltransferase n=1 Tax=Flexibacterium corallicola TaxID=3037259 RepID=UPI00286F5473|nr:GNAT family N-acetyltransferase [Pseudovibrio sp. M1P-2-3]
MLEQTLKHTAAPTIETERLILRAHTKQDHAGTQRLWNYPEVYEGISGAPATPKEAWSRLLSFSGLWPLLGYGSWVVELKESDEYVGEVGFMDYHRIIEPCIHGTPEMGWVLAPQVHGKGIGKEAVGAALEWGSRNIESPKVVCIIAKSNRASLALAKSQGFTVQTETEFKESTVFILERLLR